MIHLESARNALNLQDQALMVTWKRALAWFVVIKIKQKSRNHTFMIQARAVTQRVICPTEAQAEASDALRAGFAE